MIALLIVIAINTRRCHSEHIPKYANILELAIKLLYNKDKNIWEVYYGFYKRRI